MKSISKIILTVFIFITAACRPTTTVSVLKPAEVDTYGIERIAVLDFAGNGNIGYLASNLFREKLASAKHFKLVERSELDKILKEQSLGQSGVLDELTVPQIGKLLGVDALILGEVTVYSCKDTESTKTFMEHIITTEYERDSAGNLVYEQNASGQKQIKQKQKYEEKVTYKNVITREGVVSAGFRLIDVKTGEIRAVKQKTAEYNDDVYDDEIKLLKSQDKILADLMEQVISSFVPLITPYYENITKKFAEYPGLVYQGVELARKNLWDKAQVKFEQAIQKRGTNHAAHYNLGLTYEVQGDLDMAEKEYNAAVDIIPKKLYMEALSNIKKSKLEHEKLNKQIDNKNL